MYVSVDLNGDYISIMKKTDFVFLCEECLRTQQGKRVPPEDMQEFVLKVKTVGMGTFEVV